MPRDSTISNDSDDRSNVLDYARDGGGDDGESFTRSGAYVVGPVSTPFPPRCIKCNAPAEWRWTRNLYWVPRGVRFLAFGPGILVYAIVATVTRKKSRVSVALCERHRERRRLFLFSAVPFVVVGFGFCALAVHILLGSNLTDSYMPTYVLAIGLVLMLSGVVWLNAVSRVVKLKKVEDGVATYSGAGMAFLRSLDNV